VPAVVGGFSKRKRKRKKERKRERREKKCCLAPELAVKGCRGTQGKVKGKFPLSPCEACPSCYIRGYPKDISVLFYKGLPYGH
jgi:hypothetical protein